ncbi:hypothetical protein [Pedobacter sandarakinus]|uniref:hypothetical protein n=1 Tax=Pedobacter sandarakinus TaxID=353156 RepID=UPI0022465954|nr:hypothetical protein [Pedobacter sandarakinus]MCX2573046.1 hypothetical protein [Pedobacter sandarakinus]
MNAFINIYSNSLADTLIPKLLERLNEHEAILNINQSFSFKNSSGNLSISFKWDKPTLAIFNNNNLTVNFSTNTRPFDLKEYKKKLLKDRIVSKPFFSRFFGKKKKYVTKVAKLSSAIEEQLQAYNQVFSIKYHPGDLFESHFARLVGSIVTELSSGMCHFAHEDIWYNKANAVAECLVQLYTLEELPNHINKKPIAVAS